MNKSSLITRLIAAKIGLLAALFYLCINVDDPLERRYQTLLSQQAEQVNFLPVQIKMDSLHWLCQQKCLMLSGPSPQLGKQQSLLTAQYTARIREMRQEIGHMLDSLEQAKELLATSSPEHHEEMSTP